MASLASGLASPLPLLSVVFVSPRPLFIGLPAVTMESLDGCLLFAGNCLCVFRMRARGSILPLPNGANATLNVVYINIGNATSAAVIIGGCGRGNSKGKGND